jgi:hypothetical protein
VQRVAQEDNEYQAATAAQIEALREDARLQMGDLHDEIQQLKEVVTSQQPPPSHADGRPLQGSTVLGIGNGFARSLGPETFEHFGHVAFHDLAYLRAICSSPMCVVFEGGGDRRCLTHRNHLR